MKEVSKTSKKAIIYWSALLLFGIVFFFILGPSGHIMYKDSPWFIDRSYGYHPGLSYKLYPLFIKVCRNAFGEESYLDAISVIQSFLGLLTTLFCTQRVIKEYGIGALTGVAVFVAICAMYGYSLPEVVAVHYIAAEGITFPMFVVMFAELMAYTRTKRLISALLSLILTFLLALTRPQMILFIPIVIVVIMVCNLHLKMRIDAEKTAGLITGLIVIATVAGIYMFSCMVPRFTDNAANGQLEVAMAGKALSVMKPEDAEVLSGDEQEIFLELYDLTKSKKRLLSDYPESVLDYEKIQRIIDDSIFEHMDPVYKYYDEKYVEYGGQYPYISRNKIVASIINRHRAEFISVILRLIPSSFVASIFFQPHIIRPLCYMITFLIYAVVYAMLLYALRLKVHSKYVIPIETVLLMIFCNAVASNIILYGQQRYMVYCFGLFYISVIILIKGICIKKRTESEEKINESV